MNYLKPSTVEEATELLGSSQGMILAGGTDACVYMAEGFCDPETLIDIGDIGSLRGIETRRGEDGDILWIGACTTISEIAAAESLPRGLRQGAHAIGSPQIRNLGTIGGNICNASPCGDTLAPLLSLEARFALRSANGTRTVEGAEFFTGPKQTVLQAGELLEGIHLPKDICAWTSAFRMIGNRNGQAISQVNAAVNLKLEDGVIQAMRAAVGSVAPVPLRLPQLEETLVGKTLQSIQRDDLSAPIMAEIRPIDDVRSTATYRQELAVTLIFDALMDCAHQDAPAREGANT